MKRSNVALFLILLIIGTTALDRILGVQYFVMMSSVPLIFYLIYLIITRTVVFKNEFIFYIIFLNILLLVSFSSLFISSFTDQMIRLYGFLFWFSIFLISSSVDIVKQKIILKTYILFSLIYIIYSYLFYWDTNLISLANLGIYRFQTPIGSANVYPLVALNSLIAIYILNKKIYYLLVPLYLHVIIVCNSRTIFLTILVFLFLLFLYRKRIYILLNIKRITLLFVILILFFLIIPSIFDWYIENSEFFHGLASYRLNVETLKYRFLGTFIFWTESSLDNYGLPFGLRSIIYANYEGWAIPPDNTFMLILYEGGVWSLLLFILFLIYSLANKRFYLKPEVYLFILVTIFVSFTFLDFIKIRYETIFFWIMLGFLNHKISENEEKQCI